MKLGELKSLGHNIADSLASGIGLPIGIFQTDVFSEASSSLEGFIVLDFLRGQATGGEASPDLLRAVVLYQEALPQFCDKHRLQLADIAVLRARYGVDAVYGRHFTVTVQAVGGKTSSDRYIGVPGRRLRRGRP